MLPEVLYYQAMNDSQPAFVNSSRSLWVSLFSCRGDCLYPACSAPKLMLFGHHTLKQIVRQTQAHAFKLVRAVSPGYVY